MAKAKCVSITFGATTREWYYRSLGDDKMWHVMTHGFIFRFGYNVIFGRYRP